MPDETKSLALPPPNDGRPSRVDRVPYYQVPAEEPETQESQTPLSHYLWVVRRRKWPLLIFVVFAVAATIIVSSRMTPYYESTATVDVDRMIPTAVIGQESSTARASSMNDSDFFLSTQVKLIQSDSVLRPVAQKLKLKLAKGRPDAPVKLPRLAVTRPAKTYLLQISYRSPDPQQAADVANAIAESYKTHSYNIRYQAARDLSAFMNKPLEDLQAKMERSSALLSGFQKELNVISPDQNTSILANRVQQLNTEYTSAQADLVKKEVAARSAREGSIEALEVSGQGEQIRRLVDKIAEADQKFADVKTHYAANHPEYRKPRAIWLNCSANLK
jgi:polysaccharide biosynthesis transport protein